MRSQSRFTDRVWQFSAYALIILAAMMKSLSQSRSEYIEPRPRAVLPLARASSRNSPRMLKLGDLARPRTWGMLIRETATNWSAHKASRLGAALAYYSIFSVGPLVLIVIAIAGTIFGQDAVRGAVSSQLATLLGVDAAKIIETMLAGAAKPREGIIATAFGVATLVFAAIGVVVQLKDALNSVWEVDAKSQAGAWNFIRTYAVSVAGVLALGFLLLVSLVVSAALAAAGKLFAGLFPEAIFQVLTFAVSFGVTGVLFSMMFKSLPDASVEWADVWIGGFLTAALFEIGKLLIGLYIGKEGLASTYGAAASIVVVLIWVYYSAQIVLFGAEFTRVFATHFGLQEPARAPALAKG